MIRDSLRTKLVLWNTLALAILFGALGLVVRYTVTARVMALVDHDLDAKSQEVTHDLPPEFSPHPPQLPDDGPGPPQDGFGPPGGGFRPPWPGGADGWLRPPPPQRRGGPMNDPYFPRLFDLTGARASRPGDAPGAGLWDRPLFAASRRGHTLYATLTINGAQVRVLSRPVPDVGPVRGVVQVAYPLADVDRAVAGVGQALLLLIPLALLCAGAAGAALTGLVLRRVGQLTRAAGRISAHDPAARLPVAGRDEFAALAETFNALLERQEEAFRHQEQLVARQRQFTADASHELKTPLTVIQGTASLALSDPPNAAEYAQSLREIHQAAGTMARLVQDLLLLARSDDGQLGWDRVALPVQEVLARAVSQAAPGAAPLTLAVADESLHVAGNAEELRRLFGNLLDNARRHTPPNGRIAVAAARVGARAVVTVADSGSGIAPEHLPHLGERFYRVDSARARRDGGTGLGLSICKSIVEAHGGEITIASAVGYGTTVTVTLPAASDADFFSEALDNL